MKCSLFLALGLLASGLSADEPSLTREQRAAAHLAERQQAREARTADVLASLRRDGPAAAATAAAGWSSARGQRLTEVEQLQALTQQALRLRDRRYYREAGALAEEILRRVERAEQVSERAARERGDLAEIRASLAVGLRMDTATGRAERQRAESLDPDRRKKRPRAETSGDGAAATPTSEGGRP